MIVDHKEMTLECDMYHIKLDCKNIKIRDRKHYER